MRILLGTLSLLFLISSPLPAGDWPQFLGPERNSHYQGQDVALQWPAGGPKTLWDREVGEGYSGVAVKDEKLILFHRDENQEVVECLHPLTGKVIWKQSYPTEYRDRFGFDNGPRATPTIHERRVYTFGAGGILHGWKLDSGEKLWGLDTHQKFDVPQGFFGAACSPLVVDGKVLVEIGGEGTTGIVAFDAKTGEILWRCLKDEASYSSPVFADIDGKPQAVFFTRTGLVTLNPENGQVYHKQRWRPRIDASVNAATPLVVGNEIFLSTCYNTGAVLFEVKGQQLKKVWSNDESMSNHYNTCVYHDGYLYGLHGRQEYEPSLRCVEWKTGKVMWSEENYKAASLILVEDQLLIVREDGRIVLAPASPKAYRPTAQANVISPLIRAAPALANGLLYVRNEKKVVCVDLRSER